MVSVDIRGKLDVQARFGYPAFENAPAVYSGGLTYILDFGGNKELSERAQQLHGKRVVLTGRVTGVRGFTTMCVPGSSQVPVVYVTSLEAAEGPAPDRVGVEILGRLNFAELESFPPIPVWTVTADKQEYQHHFANADVSAAAKKLTGRDVIVTGTVRPDGSVLVNAVALGDGR
jgi:hypothetical protein